MRTDRRGRKRMDEDSERSSHLCGEFFLIIFLQQKSHAGGRSTGPAPVIAAQIAPLPLRAPPPRQTGRAGQVKTCAYRTRTAPTRSVLDTSPGCVRLYRMDIVLRCARKPLIVLGNPACVAHYALAPGLFHERMSFAIRDMGKTWPSIVRGSRAAARRAFAS